MPTREDVWKQFVANYEIDVPESAIQNELEYIKAAMRHAMTYDTLSGGESHPFLQLELEEQASELRAVAEFEAKAPLVLKAIIAGQAIDVTPEELESEARAVAARQATTVEAIKQFFGENLCMLRRDVLENKAIDWACASLGYTAEDLQPEEVPQDMRQAVAVEDAVSPGAEPGASRTQDASQDPREEFVRSQIAPLLHLLYEGDEARIETAVQAILGA